MSIDWLTVGAQVINFFILVWLMKRFLYKPILNAIAAREKRIAEEIAAAEAKKAEAQKEQDEFRQKNGEFDQQRDALMNKALEEVTAERKRLLDAARQAADELSAKRQEDLKNEAHNLKQALITKTQQEVFAIARKTLAELGSASLEASIADVFILRLQELQGTDKEELAKALKSSLEPIILRSVFDLPDSQRTAIQQAIDAAFSTTNKISFETAPELISGIELSANGYKVAWSIDAYLASVEKSMVEFLKEQDKPVAETGSKIDMSQLPAEGAADKDA